MSDHEKQPNEADLIATRPQNGVAKQDSQDTLTNKTEKPSQTDEDKKDEKKAGLGDFLVCCREGEYHHSNVHSESSDTQIDSTSFCSSPASSARLQVVLLCHL